MIAFKNLQRRKLRSSFTIGGVAIAVAVLVSLLGFSEGYKKALTSDIDKMGYQVLVTAKGCPYEAATLMLKGGGGLRYMEQGVFDKIASDVRIDKVTPQLMHTVFDPDRLEGQGGFAMCMGIQKSYLELKPWTKFKSGAWFTSDDADEAIMGFEAAELERRSVGDKTFIPGLNKILTVVGVFERTGTQDDGVVFLPLNTAQRIFDLKDKISGIGIKLKNIEDLAQFEEDMYAIPETQVISMAQVKGTLLNLVSSAKILVTSVAVIAVFVAAIGVVNTILMSVFERTQEIGVMKAIGASKLDIFCLIWMETVIMCGLGGLLGNIGALLGGKVVERIVKSLLPYAPGGQIVLITPTALLISLVGAILLGLVAGIYPALRASSMRPIEAIRSGE
ncbi:MAG: ABC transporter permease [Candidatus Coatesbacteria bacterium]|nr:ABC transporter permease [Candidatus Coatesbacteria bacterium]